MIIEQTGMQQQYCLRWNNHKNNLLTVFGELFRNEDFTDVTLACEGGSVIKCHKMVLAACSSYFQNLFSDLPCSHPVIVLKDTRYSEIQAILEYMYKGEVSVTQDEVEPLLRVAEALKVKGLVGENNYRSNKNEYTCNNIRTSSSSSPSPYNISNRSNIERSSSLMAMHNDLSSARGNANDNQTIDRSPSENQFYDYRNNSSPPHSISTYRSFHKNASCFYGKPTNSADVPDNRIPPLPIWPMAGLPVASFPTPQTTTAAMLNSCHEAVVAASNASMPPLKRKKLSSLLNTSSERDTGTPILREALGQGETDSSQPMSLVRHDAQDHEPQQNGPNVPQDLSCMMSMKMETMSEDGHSPYMETSSFTDEEFSQERGSKTAHSSPSSPQSYYMESKGNVPSALANCVQSQKPEWKRYKQYTKRDISQAIESVRNGMTALKASKKFGVPSRTLYDKVKKLGITTTRPSRRTNGSTGGAFPFGVSGAGGNVLLGMDENSSQGGMLEQGYFQHVLETGTMKMESLDRAAVPSTSISLQSHPYLQHNLEMEERMKSMDAKKRMKMEREDVSLEQENTTGLSSSPTPNNRSPSPHPNRIQYIQRSDSLTPSPPLPPSVPPADEDDYQDQVEDLSMSRKPEQQSGVIMSPINQTTGAAMLATCSGDSGRD